MFHDTSSVRFQTYGFVRECKASTELHGFPFILVEIQTYENARKGECTCLPSYRLVNDEPSSEEASKPPPIAAGRQSRHSGPCVPRSLRPAAWHSRCHGWSWSAEEQPVASSERREPLCRN